MNSRQPVNASIASTANTVELESFSYESLVDACGAGKNFPLDIAHSYISSFAYGQLENLILLHLDYLDGIKSSIAVDPDHYPTGIAFIRDATKALSLEQRLPPDHLTIKKENLVLRGLGVMRGIDQVLKYQIENKNKTSFEKERIKLQAIFQNFFSTVMDKSARDLKAIQKDFNTHLIELLHKTKLDGGMKKSDDYKKLLAHYRDLAATLDPAKSMSTIVKHEQDGFEITQIEISHPITEKTPEQIAQLDVMQKIILKQPEKYNDFHSAKKLAFQQANQAFCALIKKPNRRLPAQARKTIGPTLKNGYIVHNILEFKKGKSISTSKTMYLRCGSLAYIGEDDNEKRLERYAHENVLQLQKAAGNKSLHVTMLLTDSAINQQNIMISISKKALHNLKMYFSNIPTNIHGTLLKAELSPLLKDQISDKAKSFDLFNRVARVNLAAMTINSANKAVNIVSVVTCASGQDRTGTAQEAATLLWAEKEYPANHVYGVTKTEIELLRATGCHNAVLASLATPGSPGMKDDSKVLNYFTELTNKHYYRKEASTNKHPPVDSSTIESFIKNWQEDIVKVYEKCLLKIESATSESELQDPLLEWVKIAISHTEESNFADTIAHKFRHFSNKSPSDEQRITTILINLHDNLETGKPGKKALGEANNMVLSLHTFPEDLPEKFSVVLTQLKQILNTAILRSNSFSPTTNSPIRRH